MAQQQFSFYHIFLREADIDKWLIAVGDIFRFIKLYGKSKLQNSYSYSHLVGDSSISQCCWRGKHYLTLPLPALPLFT